MNFSFSFIHRNTLVTLITILDIIPIDEFTCGIRRFLKDKRGVYEAPLDFIRIRFIVRNQLRSLQTGCLF